MMKKKNLVFDVGGVLIGFRWYYMMTEYGLSHETTLDFGHKIFKDPLWEEFDLENLSFDQVAALYIEKYPEYEKEIHYLLENAELMVINRPEIWKMLRHLKQAGYRLYLLSNYSSVLFAKHLRDADFFDILDGKVVSYEIHAIKPAPRIYEELFERYGLDPAECLFFDDKPENTEASRQLGMDAIDVESEEQLMEELKKLLLEASY